jgi:hypothetical protein
MFKKNFLKNFDYKRFLIEKGERAVLVVAVAVLALTLILGVVTAVTSGSPDENSKAVREGTKNIDGKLKTAQPPPGLNIPDPALLRPIDARQVKADEVRAPEPYFEATPADVTKRHNPPVEPPVEGIAELVRVQVRSLMVNREGEEPTIMVLKGVKGDQHQAAGARGIQNRFGGGRPGPGFLNQPGARRGPDRSRNFDAMRGSFADSNAVPEYTLIPVKLDELREQKLAVDIRPYRMAYVVASFPYKKQMGLFKDYLRFPTLKALFDDKEVKIAFVGFKVERQTLELKDGKLVADDWKPLDLKTDYQGRVLSDAVGILPDDARLRPVLVPGLAVPRPQLSNDKDYMVYKGEKDPIAPELELKMIQKTLADWNKKDAKTRQKAVSAQGSKLKGEFGLFDPSGERKEAEAKPEEDKEERPEEGAPFKDLDLPEYCLVRFLDPSIEPGYYYKYRIQIKMANPNYKRPDLVADENDATEEFLTSKSVDGKKASANGKDFWYEIPDIVRVPDDLYLYAVDTRAGQPRFALPKEKTVVQVHRWLEQVGPTPSTPPDRLFPVGDWSVGERISVERGEAIGHWVPVKVPIWSPQREATIFLPPPSKQTGSVPVDFRTHAVMVDFEGGTVNAAVMIGNRHRAVSDDAPLEQLILTAEGKLVVHDGRQDSDDSGRKTRYDNWKDTQKKVEETVETIRNGGKKPDKIDLGK